MNKEKNLLKYALLLAVTAAIAAGIFLLGRELGGKSAETDFRAEWELNVLINRSDLEGLGAVEGPIYVTGHKSPDSDTVGSSIAYAALLQKLGYDARAVVLGDINHESALVLEKAGMAAPPRLDDANILNPQRA